MPACPRCGKDNPADARFCPECGTRLEPASRDERKVVTVLFVDVAGSTGLADRVDPEDLQEVMGSWFGVVRAEIESQGGVVEKYIGDAVMAVFGVPSAHEDDPARALRAALGIRGRLAEFNRRLAESHGIAIDTRTGINTGEAIASPDPAPGEPMVTGVAVNAAARLEQLAEPGQIVVAERTMRAARGFVFEPLGAVELRGTSEAAQAFLLTGAEPEAPQRGLPGIRAPLVGRDGELDLLCTLYERVAAEGRPHLATIYGDPGVGKSRLTREFLDRLRALPEPPDVHVGRCLSYGEGIAYWPLAEILKHALGVDDHDPAAVVLERIDALLADLLPGSPAQERSLIGAALAFTLGLDSGDAEFSRLGPSAIRPTLQRAWRMLLSALAARRPQVVIVEDIHWADPVLLDLLEEIAERAQGRIMLVCPARPDLTDTRPMWGGGRRSFSAVFLAPLSADSAGELVHHLLNVDGLTDQVRARILERAEGNPFFLEEILRQLIDQGRIVHAGGRWQASGELTHVELPDTVQGVLAARIDLLAPGQKHALQQASVVGRIFWRGAVSALVDEDEGALDADLRRLEERELVAARLTSSLAGEEELAFSHILTRDVAYQTLPRRDRPRAHARVASWIEQTTGDRRGEFVGLLAHHYGEAYRGALRDLTTDPAELERLRRHAFGLAIEGAGIALRGASYEGSRALAQSALDIAASAAERATALDVMGLAYRHSALGDEAWRCWTEAADALLADGSEDGIRIALLCGNALEQACRWSGTMTHLPSEQTAAAYLDAALSRVGDAESEARVRLMTVQCFWSHAFPHTESPYLDPALAHDTAVAAAEMAERIGRADLAVLALDAVQHNLQRQLLYEPAYASSRHRLDIAMDAGDLGELGDSYAVAAWGAIFLGRFQEGWQLGREGFDRLLHDAPLYASHSLSWAALGSFYLGEWDRLLEEFDLLLESLGERGQRPTTGYATPWPAAAFVREARGDRAACDALLEQVAGIEQRRGGISGGLSPEVVRIHILRGELAAARVRVDTVRSGDQEAFLPFVYWAEAELLVAEERWRDVPEHVALLRETAGIAKARFLPPAADWLEGRAALAAGRAAEAARLLMTAAGAFAAAGMTPDAGLAELDAAAALVEAGRAAEAREPAASAHRRFEQLGFRAPLDRAAALLA